MLVRLRRDEHLSSRVISVAIQIRFIIFHLSFLLRATYTFILFPLLIICLIYCLLPCFEPGSVCSLFFFPCLTAMFTVLPLPHSYVYCSSLASQLCLLFFPCLTAVFTVLPLPHSCVHCSPCLCLTAVFTVLLPLPHSCVIHLLRNGAKPMYMDGQGFTPLHYAACKGHKLVIQQLMDQLPEENIVTQSIDSPQTTPLHLAVSLNIPECLIYIQYHANTCTCTDVYMQTHGSTIVQAYNGHTGALDELLYRYQHHIDLKDTKGRTPLDLAAFKGHK